MARTTYNDDWTVGPNVSVFSEISGGETSTIPVTLPHDAMLTLPRHADAYNGPSTGYFAGGAVTYRKEFHAPPEWVDRVIELEFEGVYRDAMVYLNGALIGQRPNGYSPFRVRLDTALRYGQVNRLRLDGRPRVSITAVPAPEPLHIARGAAMAARLSVLTDPSAVTRRRAA